MIFKDRPYRFPVLVRVACLFITLMALAFFLLQKQWVFAVCTLPFVICALNYFIRYNKRINKEMLEFMEAVHYRDFTRNYGLQKSPVELRLLRSGFNEINVAFKKILF